MGAAGDMLSAALYELLDDKKSFIQKMNLIGIEGVEIQAEAMSKCGILGTHMNVLVNGVSEDELMHEHEHHHEHHEHEHHHSSMSDIERIIAKKMQLMFINLLQKQRVRHTGNRLAKFIFMRSEPRMP